MAPEEGNRRGSALLWGVLALACLGMLAHAAYLVAGRPPGLDVAVNNWVYNGTLLLCAATCLVRAVVSPRLRWAWLAFGLGLAAWAVGDIYWVVELADLRRIPYPSLADVGYLAALPCFFVGVALLSKHRVGRFTSASWIDGVTVSLATAGVGVALLAPALVGLTRGNTAAVMTNLAYPLGDLILIAFLAGAVAVSGVRGATTFLLIGAGLVLWTVGDALYLYLEATSSYVEGWHDLLWTGGAVLLAAGACFSVRHAPARRTATYRSPLWLPAVTGASAVALLVWDHFSVRHEAAVWLAGAALIGVSLRLAASFRETDRLVAALHDEAISDALTGLGNRRKLLGDLTAELARGDRNLMLALFDLDGFKAYNDTFGHPAGDALLRRLGVRLAEETAAIGHAYRLGGDEFCLLAATGEREVASVVETARAALSARGEGFKVGASCGYAELPAEAATASEALRIVDQRMYAEKGQRSSRVAHQTHDLLLRILRQREPELSEHVDTVARHAVRMARVLSVAPEELDVIRRAAELHDIGKIAIPDEILRKPDALDPTEWELMRRHTLVGERILGAAPALRPVAQLVRASHERWDGLGYPDGTAAEAIPLGARIIFICDAFDAMISDRPYGEARGEQEAVDELRRHAGSQFDPALVELFVRLWTAERDARDVPVPRT